MMLIRAIRVNAPGFDFVGGVNRSTSAVPSQLLPAKTTGVVVATFAVDVLTAGADEVASALAPHAASTASAATARLRLFDRAVPLRPFTSYLPSLTGEP